MNLREILEHIFPGLNQRDSRQEVKNRLKLVLARSCGNCTGDARGDAPGDS